MILVSHSNDCEWGGGPVLNILHFDDDDHTKLIEYFTKIFEDDLNSGWINLIFFSHEDMEYAAQHDTSMSHFFFKYTDSIYVPGREENFEERSDFSKYIREKVEEKVKEKERAKRAKWAEKDKAKALEKKKDDAKQMVRQIINESISEAINKNPELMKIMELIDEYGAN